MMLNAITLKSSRAAVIHVDRQGHGDGALGIRRPFAIVLIDVQVIGDDLKLIAGHLKHVVVVDSHENEFAGWIRRPQMQLLFALTKSSRQPESRNSVGSTITFAIRSVRSQNQSK